MQSIFQIFQAEPSLIPFDLQTLYEAQKWISQVQSCSYVKL